MIRRKSLRKPSHRKITKPLILVGVRQNTADVIKLASDCGYRIIGILDQYYYGNTKDFCNIPIIGDERWLLDDNNELVQIWKKQTWFFCNSWWDGRQHVNMPGLDLENVRLERIKILDNSGVRLANLISPSAIIPNIKSLTLGHGIMIFPQAFVGHNVEIGNHSVIDWQVTLSRHTKIGNNCIVGGCSHLANYLIEDNVRIGIGAILIGQKKDLTSAIIGKNSIVHLGSVCTNDIPENHIRTYTHKTMARIEQ